jgi:hypothetical protein
MPRFLMLGDVLGHASGAEDVDEPTQTPNRLIISFPLC